MACSLAIRTDRHADRLQRERTEMFGTSIRTRSRLSIALVGVALALSTSEGIVAETLRPNVDNGGSGGGSGVDASTWPNFDSTSIVVQQPATVAEQESPSVSTRTTSDRSIALIESKEAPVDVATTASVDGAWYASAAHQNQQSILRVEEKEAPVVANQESQADFALTQNGRSITLIESKEAPVEVAQSAVEGGYFAIVDEQGNAVVPELVAAGSTERMASAGSASPRMICVACATFR